MSAENQLSVFPMVNGEIWIVVQACMDHCGAGCILSVAGKACSYDEACALFNRLDDEESPEYVYTEYGGRMPSVEELGRRPIAYPNSYINVHVVGRTCNCACVRDLSGNRWEVTEYAPFGKHHHRVLVSGVTYAAAITIANQHAAWSPGEHDLLLPTRFVHRFPQSSKCDCDSWPMGCEQLNSVNQYADRFPWI